MTPKEFRTAYRDILKLMRSARGRKFGASDTEPCNLLRDSIWSAFSAIVDVPHTPSHWMLYHSMDGCIEFAAELTHKLNNFVGDIMDTSIRDIGAVHSEWHKIQHTI